MLVSPWLTAICWEKVEKSSQVVHPLQGWDFKLQFWGLPLIVLGHKPISWCYHQFVFKNTSLSLLELFYNAVCFYLVSHRILLDPRGLARPPRAEEFQDLLSYLTCHQTSHACGQARNPGGVQEGQKQGQRPDLQLLKPDWDFLHFNFPNRGESRVYRVKSHCREKAAIARSSAETGLTHSSLLRSHLSGRTSLWNRSSIHPWNLKTLSSEW